MQAVKLNGGLGQTTARDARSMSFDDWESWLFLNGGDGGGTEESACKIEV